MQKDSESSYYYGGNAPYLEALYEQFLIDPSQVDPYWREQFTSWDNQSGQEQDKPRLIIEESFKNSSFVPYCDAGISEQEMLSSLKKQVGVLRLMYSYRITGSRYANLDPLNRRMNPLPERILRLETYGLSDKDLTRSFSVSAELNPSSQPIALSEIIRRLQKTYCNTIGVEYMHIIQNEERLWVRDRFESELSTPNFDCATKKTILKKLTAAETFEHYLHTKFTGQKRFSLEGGESLIPALDYLINEAALVGVETIVIGMAHRGRLNVLTNILGKLPKDLFNEFEGKAPISLPSGDVKYHNGFSSDLRTLVNPIHISLEFNPSHLEIVNPVVEGNVRARQAQRGEEGKKQVLPILIHGDAAIAGLGVNQATLNLSNVRGYTTGGTIHIVVNNQIGFTTSDLRDARSTIYCTDIAKMIDAPIIHVNGDDPEAVCYVMKIALDFRTCFHKDIMIDMVCYRRRGHNEGDDPFLTQPMMYQAIKNHLTTRTLYAKKLVEENLCHQDEIDQLVKDYQELLDKGEHVQQSKLGIYQRKYSQNWDIYKGVPWDTQVDTWLSADEIKKLSDQLALLPEHFSLHRTVAKLVQQRQEMGKGQLPIDWGMAETLAYASLLTEGIPVRLSGEDSGRGTFSHRHAVFHDQTREQWDQGVYIPLQHVSQNQANFTVIDSILNEEAVLAYEYGYACYSPTTLTIWEAQFGDFSNGAQVAIDQFITSGEAKWGRLCGLVILLPHGYDGQGPEHSSGRLERWLQLCAEDNIQLVCPSESSQMFHVLRRQMLRPYRKPLIIFMSKRLLRFKSSMNDLTAFTKESSFRTIIDDPIISDLKKVKRLILCAGQVYYDLVAQRAQRNLDLSIAIVRLEQLYPFPEEAFKQLLERYHQVKDIMWVQEEPLNQGAWNSIYHVLRSHLTNQQIYVSARPASAAPAVGYPQLHIQQLKDLLDTALTLSTSNWRK